MLSLNISILQDEMVFCSGQAIYFTHQVITDWLWPEHREIKMDNFVGPPTNFSIYFLVYNFPCFVTEAFSSYFITSGAFIFNVRINW